MKTFFGVLGFVLIGSAVFGMTDEKSFQIALLDVEMEGTETELCPLTLIFTDIYYITVILLIPLNERITFPLFHHCIPNIICYCKPIIGIILQVVRYVALIALTVVAQHNNINMPYYTNTTLCIFQENTLSTKYSLWAIDYRLYSIPEVISAISYIMILVGVIGFLCAQIPYSMKGLIVGIFYGSLVLSLVLNKTIISHMFTLNWEAKAVFSCEFCYLQTKLIFLSITTMCALILLVYY